MSRSQFIAIVAVILIAGLLISGVLVYMNIIKQKSEKVEFLHNTDEKTVYYKGFGYSIEINYDGKFQVSRLIAKEHNILAPGRGIYLSYETKDHSFSSLNLDADPGIEIEEIDEENYAAVLNFEEENTQYEVRLDFTPYETKATIKRTIKNEISITHQGFPSINLEQDAVENIRWHRSGSNFWIAGKASNMRNFLSAGAGYLAEKGEAGFERGNVHRGVEDITFSLISSPDKKYAFRFDGSTDRDYATCVRRYEDGEFKHLEMNVTIAAPDKELRYLGHEDGWGSYSGRTVAQDAKIYRPVKMLGGQVDVVEFFIRPADYNQYFELGKLKGFDQELLSYALNNYGRLMIMDHDMGTAVESPNHFLELPALEQHWNTCIVGLFMDDAALESQKNGLKVIRDKLQALDGHITSPYPWITHDNWGSKYSDMMPGYVLANIYLYNLTGDKEFFDSMVESCIKALESQEKMYLDGKVWLCKNLVTENELNMNDYWEHTAGMYNGYTSAMYYETLVKFSTLLEALYGNQYADLVNHYLNLAEKIKEDFNRLMWSDNTNTFLYGSDNLDILYLPVQGAAIRGGIVDKDRIKLMVESVERYTAVFDLPFHVMNVLDILNENRPADQSDDYNKSMLGMNGGWYGAPDGDFYSGFPIYGDRSLIPRYINRFTDLFEKTGFIGATAYKRDGVTPADYGWYDSMPTLVQPIWGLYTYGYGFQPEHDRLNIAPFIDESMAGSVVKYRFRQVDLEVTYKSLYEFELVAMDDPKTPIYFQFINQTPNKEYKVVVNGKTQNFTADADGVISVQVEGQKTSVKLVNPDEEKLNISSLNGKPVIASSTKNGDRVTTYWSICLTDGKQDLYWVPRTDDEEPYAIVALGGKAELSNIIIHLKEEARLKYYIEGTNDPTFKEWKVIVDNSKKESSGKTLEHNLKGAYHYIRIRFVDTYPDDIMITEIETRAKQEGIDNPNAFQDNFDLDKPPIMINNSYVNIFYHPPFQVEILERKGNLIIYRDIFGQIVQNYEGVSNIPKILKSPVNNFEEWEAFKKEKLNPEDESRWAANWPEIAEMLNNQDRPVQIGTYPCGLFGTLRDLMGVEGCLLAFYDEPELVKDIMDYLTDYWIYMFEKICKDVKVDVLHIWEDMSGKQGSLISPDHIREFMLPNYKKFKDMCDKYDIPVFMVDTDGNCEELIPLFAEAGVNLMLPFEVAAGCDVVAWREKYPYMAMMGGIDKREIAKGKEAIDRELDRISPLLNKPGYFPALDHLIPPEISYEDYTYFVNRLIEMVKG